MSTMVTGGFGYLGRRIVALLLDGGVKVVSYDRDYSEGGGDQLVRVQGELFDIPRIIRTIQAHGVSSIIHTAGMSHPDLSIELPLTTVAANIDGTVHLLEAMRLAGLKRLVNLSSETVYGHLDGEIVETSPVCPTTPYGVTKVATELMGKVYNELFQTQVVSLRVTEIYGPGNKMPQITRDIIKTILNDKAFELESGGDHPFQLVHVDDAARACVLASQAADVTGWVFNVSGGIRCSMRQMIQIIEDSVPSARIRVGDGCWHLDRQGPWNIEAAKRELGYQPAISLRDGIGQYVEWLRSHGA